jgi:hypothetical protein
MSASFAVIDITSNSMTVRVTPLTAYQTFTPFFIAYQTTNTWVPSPLPSTSITLSQIGTTSVFSGTITGLTPNTTYYLAAYCTYPYPTNPPIEYLQAAPNSYTTLADSGGEVPAKPLDMGVPTLGKAPGEAPKDSGPIAPSAGPIAPSTGPTDLTACFKEGTKILTRQGYKKIETLKKGDLLKTINNGFVAIDLIGKKDIYHSASETRIKDQLYQCSSDKYPSVFEDLVLTGAHSILVDEFASESQKEKAIEVNGGEVYVTDGKYRLPACADSKTTVYKTSGVYTIYHIALENENYSSNYGIYANGLLVESCSKKFLIELSGMDF